MSIVFYDLTTSIYKQKPLPYHYLPDYSCKIRIEPCTNIYMVDSLVLQQLPARINIKGKFYARRQCKHTFETMIFLSYRCTN